ncbi:MAG TPA: hypothetical protein VGK89_01055 [Candidatus Eisenbacteria bacterium]|jgi:hypothetical protein
MTRLRRLLFLLLPLGLGLGSAALPGRAQQSTQGRFAFADTTLLRDTLGLSFEGLFPLADSLGMTPDSLRALSIRYRYALGRLLTLADSLGVVVDSVGPVLRRERFNPLAAAGARNSRSFAYNSTYDIGRNSSTWVNGSDYSLVAGSIIVNSNTSIQIDRRRAGGITNLDQTQALATRADWKFSNNFSLGGSANLDRTDNRTRGAIYNQSINNSLFQVSARSRQQPARGLNSELNLSGGLLKVSGSTQEKSGLSGDVNGRVRYLRGSWLVNDLGGQLTGNLARTGSPGSLERSNTRDLSNSVRGTMGLFTSAPVGLNLNYNLQNSRVEIPAELNAIQQVRTGRNGLDATLRLRIDNDRYLSFAERLNSSRQANASVPSSQNTSNDQGFTLSGRYGIRALSLDASFGRLLGTSKYPFRGQNGGYGEDRDNRNVDATLTWTLSRFINAKAAGGVSLSRSRYFVLGNYPNLPVPRDSYRQYYRLEGRYSPSPKVGSGVRLEVNRTLQVNLPAASTAANSESRGYRAAWDWNYRLLSGLTATQTNQINADYTYYTFLPASSDRLSLDYYTHTVLNAVILPSLQLDVTHDYRYQPSGGYAPIDPLGEGPSYFSQADDGRSSSLKANLRYRASSALSLNVSPEYTASDRHSVSEGVVVPQRTSRTLIFTGGASLNFTLGEHGQLTGDIGRRFQADGTTEYQSGAPRPRPSSEYDFWTGSLRLSWGL